MPTNFGRTPTVTFFFSVGAPGSDVFEHEIPDAANIPATMIVDTVLVLSFI
jgi:hypothetical protein